MDKESKAVVAAAHDEPARPAAQPHAGPAKAEKPKTFAQQADDLRRRLDQAHRHRDGEAIGKLYDELDALKPSNPAEETAHRALAARFTHLAPRKLGRINEIEAALDGEVSGKARAAAPPPEHPAVTKAKADLARLDSEHAGNIPIPRDAEALASLQDKMATVPPPKDAG